MLSRCDKCTTYQLSASPSDGDTFKYEQHVIQYTACETEKTDDDLQASQNQKNGHDIWSAADPAIPLS